MKASFALVACAAPSPLPLSPEGSGDFDAVAVKEY